VRTPSVRIGPRLVITDEPQNPNLSLEVHGHRYQCGSTKTTAFGTGYLVSYLSLFMSRSRDIISTGTLGVGLGRNRRSIFVLVT
jgi:2-keto-4-pentenoate hydratase/2-oxohepta-3-ene-1,7-dioic acid hydratase in catechol pathway